MHLMIARTIFLILCAAPALVLAQNASVAGPVAGYVFDPAGHSIRPMLGIPGAAYMGTAIANDLDAAAIAPDGSSALVASRGRVYRVLSLNAPIQDVRLPRHASLIPLANPVDGAITGADRMVWSADQAAIYSSVSGQAQILSGMSKAPSAGAVLDLSGLPGAVTAIAVNAGDLLVGVAGAGVYRIPAGGSPQLIAPAQYPVGLRIAGGSTGLFFADRDGGSVWQIADCATGSTPMRFAGDLDTPVALHVSGSQLFVASAGGRTLIAYDLTTHAATKSLDLAFTPASFDPMGSASLLLMAASSGAGQPYYVLDTSQDPAVWFVPEKGVQQ